MFGCLSPSIGSGNLFRFGVLLLLVCGTVPASAVTSADIPPKEVSTGTVKRSGKLTASDRTTMGSNTVYARFFNFKAEASGTAKVKSSSKDCMYFLSVKGSNSKSQPQSLSVTKGGSYVVNVVGRSSGTSFSFTLSVPTQKQKPSSKTSLKSISISGASSVKSGKSITLKCKAKFSNGKTKNVKPTWSIISGSAYAKISSSGKFTAYSTGLKRIVKVQASYTYNGVTKNRVKTSTIKAGPKKVKRIVVTYYPWLYSGMSKPFKCEADFNTDVTVDVTKKTKWTITSGGEYASISSAGVFTAKTTTVTRSVKCRATYTYKKSTRKVNVTVEIRPYP